MTIELYPYQQVGVFRGIYRYGGRVLLADDVGLGKTVQSLYIAQHFWDEETPIIVVCPAAVKYQWEYEVHKTTGMLSWVLNGTKPPVRKPLHIPPVIILNWDILKAWRVFLKLLGPKIIIGDEIVAIKAPGTQRTKEFRLLCQGVPYIMGLSGTPIENSPVEIFNILNILRKDIFPAFRPFAFRYSVPKVTPWGVKFEGAANCEELHDLLIKTCTVRRTKQEVLKELPPVTRSMIPIDIERKEYEQAEKNFLGWLYKQNPGKAMRIRNAVHLAKMTYILGLIAKLKIPGIIEWIDEFLNTGKKLVVFGHHREFLERLHKQYDRESVLVYGGINLKKRQAAINAFADNPKVKIFFGSITAAGTGINRLQTVCSDVVIGELIWNPKKIIQGEGRLDRLGQTEPVTAHYLIAQNTAEAILCRTIWKKQSMSNAIIDGQPDLQEFDILEECFEHMLKKKGKSK